MEEELGAIYFERFTHHIFEMMYVMGKNKNKKSLVSVCVDLIAQYAELRRIDAVQQAITIWT